MCCRGYTRCIETTPYSPVHDSSHTIVRPKYRGEGELARCERDAPVFLQSDAYSGDSVSDRVQRGRPGLSCNSGIWDLDVEWELEYPPMNISLRNDQTLEM